VVEWDGLENRCTGNCTEGSNPSLSAFGRRSFSEGDLLICGTLAQPRRPSADAVRISNIFRIDESSFSHFMVSFSEGDLPICRTLAQLERPSADAVRISNIFSHR